MQVSTLHLERDATTAFWSLIGENFPSLNPLLASDHASLLHVSAREDDLSFFSRGRVFAGRCVRRVNASFPLLSDLVSLSFSDRVLHAACAFCPALRGNRGNVGREQRGVHLGSNESVNSESQSSKSELPGFSFRLKLRGSSRRVKTGGLSRCLDAN